MFVIGTVAGPEDHDLLEWAEHWKPRGHLLILVQGGPEWLATPFAEQLQKLAPESDIIPVLPVGNPDLHWNSLMAIAQTINGYEALLIKGTDEFMSDDCWQAMVKAIQDDPEGEVWWMFRKDYFDGHCFPGLEGSFQPTVVRGIPMKYGVNFHSFPSPACSVDRIRYLPDSIFVEHRRSLKRTIKANRDREQIARPREAHVQNQFLGALKKACDDRGIAWPEEQK